MFQVFKEVLKYIRRDRNKLAVLSTCHTLRALFMTTTFTDIYDYHRVKDLSWLANLKYIQYTYRDGKNRDGSFYGIDHLPKYITHVYVEKDSGGIFNHEHTRAFIGMRIQLLYLCDGYPYSSSSLVLVSNEKHDDAIEVADNVTHLRISCGLTSLKGKSIAHLTLGKKAEIPNRRIEIVQGILQFVKITHFLVPPSVQYLRIHW